MHSRYYNIGHEYGVTAAELTGTRRSDGELYELGELSVDEDGAREGVHDADARTEYIDGYVDGYRSVAEEWDEED